MHRVARKIREDMDPSSAENSLREFTQHVIETTGLAPEEVKHAAGKGMSFQVSEYYRIKFEHMRFESLQAEAVAVTVKKLEDKPSEPHRFKNNLAPIKFIDPDPHSLPGVRSAVLMLLKERRQRE